jgi:hypothetical protein
MRAFPQKPLPHPALRLKPLAALLLLSAALMGEALAAPSCGRTGFWEGEGLQREVAFSNRLVSVFSGYFTFPTQDWLVTKPARRSTYDAWSIGEAVCKGRENVLRGGIVAAEYIFTPPAQNRIEADIIREECRDKERELEKLPPEKQAQVDEKKRQTRELLGNKGALAGFTAEEQKARQDTIAFENRTKSEHRDAMRPQLDALFKDCRVRTEPLTQDTRYSVQIQVNPGGSPKNSGNDFHLVTDLGDKSIRSGPNDKVRRILVYITPTSQGAKFNAARSEADLNFLKTQINIAGLQALIDGGGGLPSDADLASVKAAQQAGSAEFAKWEREQSRQVSQADRERNTQRQAQERDARRAAQGLPPAPAPAAAPVARPAPTPRPAVASPAGNPPAQDTAAAPAATPAPAPASPPVPNIPQLPGNVGNILRGVFGR